jgi:putative NADH-flavin reductase
MRVDEFAGSRCGKYQAMNILCFGANGATGRILVAQALAEGHAVTAYTRHPEAFPLRDDRLQLAAGDVFDPSSVDKAISGRQAVLSSLGVPFSLKPITVYSQGMANIVQAMQHHGVRRLVCVSATPVDPRYDTQGGFLFEKVLKPVISHTLGRTMYTDLRRMENLVVHSDLDWTILRPSGLFGAPSVTDYQVTGGFVAGQYTSRTDLADCMLRQLDDEQNVHKALAVATVSGQPSFLKFFLSEGIGKKAA